MPFCRKCGRRLVEYSKSCPDCGTSTTAPLINLKKASASHNFKAPEKGKVVRAILPPASPVVIKVNNASKRALQGGASAKHDIAAEIVIPPEAKIAAPAKRAAKIEPTAAYVPKILAPPKPAVAAKPVFSAKHKVTPKRKVAIPVKAVIRPTEVNIAPKQAMQPKPQPQVKVAKQPKPAAVTPNPVELPKPAIPPRPITPAPVYPPHKIIKSNTSIKEDIIAHPHDYETQTFEFDLVCPNRHFWPEGASLPVSKGKAYCPQCGEQLRKPKPKRSHRRRYQRF